MRIIKLALISFIFLFGIITVISLLIPSHIQLSKIITIRADKNAIFSLIKNKDQWNSWHPAFSGVANNQQNLSAFNTQVLAENDSVLQMHWQQPGKKPIKTAWQLYKTPGDDYGTLQWRMDFDLAWYPWQKLGSLFYEANYGRMMEQGLLNIKTVVEK